MLEDDFRDVLRKALAGHGINPAEAAAMAGLKPANVDALLRGGFDPDAAAAVGQALGMNVEACRHHASHAPPDPALAGVHRIELPFSGGTVNAWWIERGETGLLFDAGCDTGDFSDALRGLNAVPQHAFITHAHRDHIGGLTALKRMGAIVHGPPSVDASAMHSGDSFNCGSLRVLACDLSGHADPALGYRIDGLDLPVLVTGDALFAGSIGGCATPTAYRRALQRLHEALATLPPETVLLPGHGPPTTLAAERRGNPFL
jgi:glyoxylase-like metal-dependent hydrolase (beta-lactamase superfamily II)